MWGVSEAVIRGCPRVARAVVVVEMVVQRQLFSEAVNLRGMLYVDGHKSVSGSQKHMQFGRGRRGDTAFRFLSFSGEPANRSRLACAGVVLDCEGPVVSMEPGFLMGKVNEGPMAVVAAAMMMAVMTMREMQYI